MELKKAQFTTAHIVYSGISAKPKIFVLLQNTN